MTRSRLCRLSLLGRESITQPGPYSLTVLSRPIARGWGSRAVPGYSWGRSERARVRSGADQRRCSKRTAIGTIARQHLSRIRPTLCERRRGLTRFYARYGLYLGSEQRRRAHALFTLQMNPSCVCRCWFCIGAWRDTIYPDNCIRFFPLQWLEALRWHVRRLLVRAIHILVFIYCVERAGEMLAHAATSSCRVRVLTRAARADKMAS